MKRILLLTLVASALLAFPLRSAKHENWIEVRSPNFTVISNAGEKQARKTALQFEQIRTVFRDSLAVAREHPTPVITIFAAKDEKSLSELLPEYWTPGHSHVGGLFSYRMDQFNIAVNLDAQGDNPFKTVYHEYYHALTMPYIPNLPTWLSEGLADFFGNTEISGGNATMGKADPRLIMELRGNTLIPLDVLFKVTQSSPYYNEQNKTSVFYAESWALTHYLLIGDNQSHRQALLDFATAVSRGESTNEAAARVFGDINKLQRNLHDYVGKSTFSFFKMKAPAELPPSDVSARPLSEAEADAYRGGFFAMRGQVIEANAMLQEALQLDPNLALAYQNMALSKFFSGQRDAALASTTKAISLDSKNALTRYLRAYLVTHGVGPRDYTQVEADLRESIALNPNFAPPYGLLAWYLAERNRDLPEALALGQRAVALEPANTSYQLDLAQVLAHMQRFDEAQKIATRARDGATDPQQRAHAEEFLSYLQRFRDYQAQRPAAASGPRTTADATATGSRMARPAGPDPRVNTKIEGKVKDATCDGKELRISLEVREVDFDLHARDYSRVNFNEGTPFENGMFDPCTQLKGQDVEVTFITVENRPYDGEILSVEIEKPN
jgi:tetratricopeptide (TPR) repeat protein